MSEMTAGNIAVLLGDKETPRGIPMPFLFREVLRTCSSVSQAVQFIEKAKRTCSFFYVIGDADDHTARLLLTTRKTFLVFSDCDPKIGLIAPLLTGKRLPQFEDIVYGSHYNEKMAALLRKGYGKITARYAREVIAPEVMMPKSNLQSVVYDLTNLRIWVANAKGREPAAKQSHIHFDLASAFKKRPPVDAEKGR
jgi:hypothetical protein